MTLRELLSATRQELARRLADRPAVLADAPRRLLAPTRSGWCRIVDTSDASVGLYGVTEQWWDPDAGPADWSDAAGPPGLVNVEAREVRGQTGGAVGQAAPFWQQRRRDGTLETYVELPTPPARLAKAIQNWSYPDGGSAGSDDNGLFRVKCNPSDGEGGWDTETTVTIHLPVPVTHTGGGDEFAIGHPNVIEDDILRYAVDESGKRICVSAYLDAPIGTVRLWSRWDYTSHVAFHVPAGWQVADGTNSTPDLRGRFVVGTYGGSGVPGGTLGDAGDYQDKGDTGGDYRHQKFLDAGNTFASDAPNGAYAGYTIDADDRPPWLSLPLIVRIDNSSSW